MSEIKIQSEKIKMVPIEQIIDNNKNANKHSEEQIKRLCKLIEFQGWRNPLIISNRTGFLVAGHGRKLAAERLGIKELPVIYQDFENEAQEYAYLISDNEIARWAELDKEAVMNELTIMEIDDIELLGIKDFDLLDLEPEIDEPEIDDETKFLIVIECKDELQQMDLHNEFQIRELQCKLMS